MNIYQLQKVSMTSNTVYDFLKTSEHEDSYITCPSCGSPLGIRTQGYEMLLTDNLKLELDTNLASLRLFLVRLEKHLEQRNLPINPLTTGSYPYSQERNFYSETISENDEEEENDSEEDKRFLGNDGTYGGIIGKDAAEELVKKKLDFFQYIKNFDNFPLKDEKDEEVLYRECKSLVRGLEPRSIVGPLISLVFDQRSIFQWRQELSSDPERKKLKQILNEVCPTIQWYLNKTLDLHAKRKDDDKIPNAILRAQLILALLLGHKATSIDYSLNKISMGKGVRYTLPRLTVVSYKNLLRLLHSEILLGNPKMGLSPEFQKFLKYGKDKIAKQATNPQQGTKSNPENQIRDSILRASAQWSKEIHKLIHFACTGEIGTERKQCGWYPREGETRSIILLGSPGTSKSSVMLTGLVSLCDHIAALGATVAFDLPDDREKMRKLDENYRKGIMPDPTQLGDQTSIKLSVQFPEISQNRTHFVFTDIPGEDLARSLTDEGALAWVLKILKNADTIIFFFDLSIEPTVREKLTKTRNAEVWKPVLENYERVNNSRKGKAGVRQFDLLEELINDLQTQRGNLDNINFICVIPKSDLYAKRDGEKERLFFTSFYEKMETHGLFVKSDFDKQDDESFDSLCSLGGTGYKPKDTKESSNSKKSKVILQKEIGRLISNEARSSLMKVGNALGEDAVPAFKIALSELIQLRLITRIESTFGQDKVYFLPVSAQGKDTSKFLEVDSPKGISIGGIPNQKFSEYVFLLPISLAEVANLEQENRKNN